jgi:hypothetical protein
MSRDRPPHCGVVGAAHGWMVEGGLSLVAHCGNGGKMRCGNRNQNKLMIVKSSDSRSLVATCAAVAQPARFTQLPTRTCSLLSSVRPVERESRTGAVSVRHVDGCVWQRSFKTCRSAVHDHEGAPPHCNSCEHKQARSCVLYEYPLQGKGHSLDVRECAVLAERE